MFKDLTLPITGTPGDQDALAAAIALASAFDAHLSVLEMVNLPMLNAGPWGLPPDDSLFDVYKTLRLRGERNAVALREQLSRETIASEVRVVESLFLEPWHVAAHCAHYADLTVVTGAPADARDAEITNAYAGSLLVESGRPVLVVPQGGPAPMPPRRILAAWKPTREAARAFHDALPLLCQADAVDVLVVDPVPGERGHGEEPGADIATHLSRHGVAVNAVVLPGGEDDVSAVLLRHAARMDAQLVVAGGYGHSRFREWALGGVTRDLLRLSRIPLLYSH